MATEQGDLPLPSSTVLLLRDGDDGMEVFMVKRHHEIDFAAGALVFPGGKTDPADGDPALIPLCRGGGGMAPDALAFRVSAIREVFEESGILLAREKDSDAIVGADRAAELGKVYRKALEKGEITMTRFAQREVLELAVDALVHFAHWVTPKVMKKRFTTHFFLATAPQGQAGVHDGHESVDSLWLTPRQAIEDRAAGRRTIVFPTIMNLERLGRDTRTADALATARAATIVTVIPEPHEGPDGKTIRIPRDAGYDRWEVPLEEVLRENVRKE